MNKVISGLLAFLISSYAAAALVISDTSSQYATRSFSDAAITASDTRYYFIWVQSSATDLSDQHWFIESRNSAAQRGLRIKIATSKIIASYRDGGAVEQTIDLGTIAASTNYGILIGYSSGTLSAWINSTTENTKAITTPDTSAIERIEIGRLWNSGAASSYGSGKISYLYYYDAEPSTATISALMAGARPSTSGSPVMGWDLVSDANQDLGGSTAFTVGGGATFDSFDPVTSTTITVNSVTGSASNTIRSGESFTINASDLTTQTGASRVTIQNGVDGDDVLCTVTGWNTGTGNITVTAPTANLMHTGTKTIEVFDAVNGSNTIGSISYLPPTGYTFSVLGAGPTFPDSSLAANMTGEQSGDEFIYQTSAIPDGTVSVDADWEATISSATEVNHSFSYAVRDATDGSVTSNHTAEITVAASGTKKIKFGAATGYLKRGGNLYSGTADHLKLYNANPLLTTATELAHAENITITSGTLELAEADLTTGSINSLVSGTDYWFFVFDEDKDPFAFGEIQITVD